MTTGQLLVIYKGLQIEVIYLMEDKWSMSAALHTKHGVCTPLLPPMHALPALIACVQITDYILREI